MATRPSLRRASSRSVLWPWLLSFCALAAGIVGLPSACAGPKDCERNSDCDHAYCSQGECKRDCVMSSVDCPAGYQCNDIGRCESPDGGLPDGSLGGAAGVGGNAGAAGGPSQGGSSNGGSSAGGASQGGAGGGPAGSGGGGALKEFDNCTQDSECVQGLVCLPMGVSQSPRCTRTCSSSSQCMAGTRCAPVPPAKKMICAFDDDGKPCSSTGTGQCADFCMYWANHGYCTSVCENASQCPAGWGCSQPIGGTRVCLKLDVPCSQPTDCAGQACDDVTLIVNGCSMPCNSAYDCPQRPANLPPWVCESGFCFRPGDVFGPAGKEMTTSWACNAQGTPVNVCADGLTFDSPPSLTCNETETVPTQSPCVSSCLPSGGCGAGYACVSGIVTLGPICIKTGYVEIGGPCSKNEDCRFGRCLGNKCSRDCSADQVCPAGFSCQAGTCQ